MFLQVVCVFVLLLEVCGRGRSSMTSPLFSKIFLVNNTYHFVFCLFCFSAYVRLCFLKMFLQFFVYFSPHTFLFYRLLFSNMDDDERNASEPRKLSRLCYNFHSNHVISQVCSSAFLSRSKFIHGMIEWGGIESWCCKGMVVTHEGYYCSCKCLRGFVCFVFSR